MATAAEQIISELKRQQGGSGLGVVAFAKHLGVSPALWVLTRDGQRPLGMRLAMAAKKAYPEETEQLVTSFLLFELPTRNRKVAIPQSESEGHAA